MEIQRNGYKFSEKDIDIVFKLYDSLVEKNEQLELIIKNLQEENISLRRQLGSYKSAEFYGIK